MYCSTKELWNTAANRGLTNITMANNKPWDKNFAAWKFSKTEPVATEPANNIGFDFWAGYDDYSVGWVYDLTTKRYQRHNGGKKQIDFNSQEQLTTKNLIVQFVPEVKSIDVHGHNLYKLVGTGKGVLYQNGTKQDISWSKASRAARTVYKVAGGKEVEFLPGNIWIEIVPSGNQISHEAIPQS